MAKALASNNRDCSVLCLKRQNFNQSWKNLKHWACSSTLTTSFCFQQSHPLFVLHLNPLLRVSEGLSDCAKLKGSQMNGVLWANGRIHCCCWKLQSFGISWEFQETLKVACLLLQHKCEIGMRFCLTDCEARTWCKQQMQQQPLALVPCNIWATKLLHLRPPKNRCRLSMTLHLRSNYLHGIWL